MVTITKQSRARKCAFEASHEFPEAGHTLAIDAGRCAQVEALARAMLANRQAASEMDAILTVDLIGQRRSFDEAFTHLKLAVDELPVGRMLAADTLVEIGRSEIAALQVSTLLQSAAATECERAVLKRWLATVNASESTLAAPIEVLLAVGHRLALALPNDCFVLRIQRLSRDRAILRRWSWIAGQI